jgi:hypothetical protein
MHRSLSVLLFLACPAAADVQVSAAEFEAFATGKTLTYSLGGAVIWAFKDQQCRKGFWYEEAGQVCFLYEDDPAAQCWAFRRDGSGLQALFSGDPEGAEPSQVQESAPLTCAGPDLGV